MKTLVKVITFNILLICSIDLHSKAIVCFDDLMLDCIEFNRISLDGGVTWRDACCTDFTNSVANGYTCEDDCNVALNGSNSSRSNSTYSLLNKIPIEGIEFKINNENLNEDIFYTLEFIGERIYLNGKIIARVKESINTVEILLPRTNQIIRLKSVPPNTKKISAILQEVSKIETPVEILLSPNPNKGEELNIAINKKVKRIVIYNMQGQVVYIHNSLFEGSCVIALPNLKAGAYIVEFEFLDRSPTKREKIIVLD